MKVNINYVFIFLIFVELLFLFFNSNELFKEKIDYIISPEGNVGIKILSIILLILFILAVYYSTQYINKRFFIDKIISVIFIILTITILIEYKLSTNPKFSTIENNTREALSKSTTGDFVLFRSYHSYDIPELFFYRYLNSLFCNIFFGHIGIIVKQNGIPYILECTEDYYKSELNNDYKNGVIYHKAYDRIQKYSGTVYLTRNNIDKFIDNDKIREFMDKYKNYTFLEKNISCITLIIKFLEYFKLLKNKIMFMLPYDFTNKEIYKIDYQPVENIKIMNKFQKNQG